MSNSSLKLGNCVNRQADIFQVESLFKVKQIAFGINWIIGMWEFVETSLNTIIGALTTPRLALNCYKNAIIFINI